MQQRNGFLASLGFWIVYLFSAHLSSLLWFIQAHKRLYSSQGDITKLDVHAIVNAANGSLLGI